MGRSIKKTKHNMKNETEKTEKKDSIKFDLSKIGFVDLEGTWTQIRFDNKEVANTLYPNSTTIEFDDFVRSIHKTGTAEVEDMETLNDMVAILEMRSLYNHRVRSAVKEYVESLTPISNG